MKWLKYPIANTADHNTAIVVVPVVVGYGFCGVGGVVVAADMFAYNFMIKCYLVRLQILKCNNETWIFYNYFFFYSYVYVDLSKVPAL